MRTDKTMHTDKTTRTNKNCVQIKPCVRRDKKRKLHFCKHVFFFMSPKLTDCIPFCFVIGISVTGWVCEKIAQNVAQYIFWSKLIHTFHRRKHSTKFWPAWAIFKKLPIVNNHPQIPQSGHPDTYIGMYLPMYVGNQFLKDWRIEPVSSKRNHKIFEFKKSKVIAFLLQICINLKLRFLVLEAAKTR
jgi:hypothetical protein